MVKMKIIDGIFLITWYLFIASVLPANRHTKVLSLAVV